jgi:hypothetical protein
MRRAWFIAVLVLVLTAVALSGNDHRKPPNKSRHHPAAAGQQNTAPKKSSHLRIDSGELLSASGMPIHVEKFDALVGGDQAAQQDGTGKKAVVTILDGSALLTPDALTRLLTKHLSGNSNIHDLAVATEPGKVKIKGKSHKLIDIPFEIEGSVSATPQGFVKLQISDESAAHMPKALSEKMGLDLRKIVPSDGVKGIHAEKDSLTFDPDLLWGLPIHGHVTQATLEAHGLVLTFASPGPAKRPAAQNSGK